MINRIIKMRDYSARVGADGSVRGFIEVWRAKVHKEKGVLVQVNGLGTGGQGNAVMARIWQGQWIGDCECGGAESVDPAEPIFFCWGCANNANNGFVRPVVFPANWEEVERVILERPVHETRGVTDLERAGMARAAVVVKVDGELFPLTRSWNPDESLDEVKRQNEALKGVEVKPGKVTVVEVQSEGQRLKVEGLQDEVSDGIR